MSKSRPLRKVLCIHRFTAVTILVLVVSVGAVALTPRSSAAAQNGPAAVTTVTAGSTTSIPGKNPHGPLCRKIHGTDLTFHKQEPNLKKLKSGNWRASQSFYLAYYEMLSKTSQAVVASGMHVPADVRSAARKEVTDIKVLQKIILKAKSLDGLDASANGSLPGVLSAWTTVLQYVGAQCGLVGSSSSTVIAGQS
jgi:hypothetical protein